MVDRQKAIEAFIRCGTPGACSDKCAYFSEGFNCYRAMKHDLLELLKDQQETIASLQGTICKLNAALAEQPEQKHGHWISTKDRLPDKQPCEYLVVNGNNVETAICLDNRWITPRRVIKITHWMPLPEPPEVKQDD